MEVDKTMDIISSTDSFIKQNLHESNDESNNAIEKNWNTCKNWYGLMGSDKIANKCAEEHLKPISKKRIKSLYWISAQNGTI